MTITESLHVRLALAASRPAASEASLSALTTFFHSSGCSLPDDYRALLGEATELEISVDRDAHIRLWDPAGVVEMNEAHSLQSYLQEAVAIGDDEGEDIYVFMTGESGFGIYRTSFADPDPDEVVFISSSIRDLLVDGRGLDLLFDW